MASVAERTKKVRMRLGMDQAHLSRVSGVSQATISRIESGQVTQPKSETLQCLADALHVPIDYLVGRFDTIEPDEVTRSDRSLLRIIELYNKMSGQLQRDLLELAEFFASKNRRDSEEDDAL